MILSRPEILKKIKEGLIIADGILDSQIAEHSIDCSLNKYVWLSNLTNKENNTKEGLIGEFIKSVDGWDLIDITNGHTFYPGDFCLPIVDEFIGSKAGSGICCEFKLKSTAARHGIDHSLAGFIEEGYFNRLCLEFSFYLPITLKAGDLVGQFVFHKLTSAGQNYANKESYQKTSNLEQLKANWKPESVLPKRIKNKNK